MAPKKKPDERASLEDSLLRLEAIADQLQQGSLPLEESLRLYEEGLQLTRVCAEQLQQASLSIRRLEKDMQGTMKLLDEESDNEHD